MSKELTDVSDFFGGDAPDEDDFIEDLLFTQVTHADDFSHNAEKDYRRARQSLHELIEAGRAVLNTLYKQVAMGTTAPTIAAYSGHIRLLASLDKDLLALDEKYKTITTDVEVDSVQTGTNIENVNVLIQATTDDILGTIIRHKNNNKGLGNKND
jgi:hypothetical protein